MQTIAFLEILLYNTFKALCTLEQRRRIMQNKKEES